MTRLPGRDFSTRLASGRVNTDSTDDHKTSSRLFLITSHIFSFLPRGVMKRDASNSCLHEKSAEWAPVRSPQGARRNKQLETSQYRLKLFPERWTAQSCYMAAAAESGLGRLQFLLLNDPSQSPLDTPRNDNHGTMLDMESRLSHMKWWDNIF